MYDRATGEQAGAVAGRGVDPWVVDGTKTKTEYFGAIDFPYVHPGLKLSGGHVFVNIEQNLKTLHVFVQNAPGLLKGEIRVYIDNGRFKTSPDGDTTFNEPTSEDRAYAIDLMTGAKRLLRPVKTNGVINWQTFLQLCLPGQPCPQETFEGVLGAIWRPTPAAWCASTPSTPSRCRRR